MQRGREPDRYRPRVEALEPRLAPAVGVRLEVGLLDVQGAGNDDILVRFNAGAQQYEVLDAGVLAATAPADLVQRIRVKSGGGNSILAIDPTVTIRTELVGTAGDDRLIAGSGEAIMDGQGGDDLLVGGPKKLFAEGGDGDDNLLADGGPAVLLAGRGDNTLVGGAARDRLYSGPGTNLLVGNGGVNAYFDGSGPTDVVPGIEDLPGFPGLLPPEVVPPSDFDLNSFVSEATESTQILTAAEADQILARAAAASASEDAIIAIVDRTGRILAVRVEAGVDPGLIADPATLSFAIDGAIAKARTGAFFANNAAPLNSRTIQFISQSTKTEREIESNPNILDPDSSLRGPGFVAPIGIGGHFPPVSFTPSANLFDIEHTNRDRLGGVSVGGVVSGHAGADGIAGTADDPVTGAVGRFNIPLADYAPGKVLEAPISFGEYSGLFPNGQSRGIGTLPGGIPLYKNGQVVGGIGVFFPGKTGYANEENSVLSSDYDPTKPDRSLEAEWMAFAAAGGSAGAGAGIGTINGVGALPGFDLPFGRIDVDGITVPIFGPLVGGVPVLVDAGLGFGNGNPASQAAGLPALALIPSRDGVAPPNGWIVPPKDSADGTLKAADVVRIISEGVEQAAKTRAAIRLPLNTATAMVLAVSDNDGNVIGLYRMPDATFFSVDVAVAKSRNVTYYSRPTGVEGFDRIDPSDGDLSALPAGTATSNRTFRFLALPFYPTGIDGSDPGPFSILNDGGTDLKTGLQIGPPQPASDFISVAGHDAFFPGTNFRDPRVSTGNANGIVFFPGSRPLYLDADGTGIDRLVAGFGVSGDGVEQDDVVTFSGAAGYDPFEAIRADQFIIRDVRLPLNKFPRNPEARATK